MHTVYANIVTFFFFKFIYSLVGYILTSFRSDRKKSNGNIWF